MSRTAALLLLLAVAACSGSPPSGTGVIALTGGTVIDVVSGRTIANAVVLISGGHILSIGPRPDRPVPPGATEVELPGSWIIPGLIDMHASLSPWGMKLVARWGVTTVRDFATSPATAASLSNHSDSTRGPRLIIALPFPDPAIPEPDLEAATETAAGGELRTILMQLSRDGATWLLAPELASGDSLTRLVGAARSIRLLVAADGDRLGATVVARSGANSIEGLAGMAQVKEPVNSHRDEFELWAWMQRGWLTADTARLGEVAATMVGHEVGLVPALVQNDTWSRLDDSSVSRRAELGSVPDSVRNAWSVAAIVQRTGWTRSDFADFRMARAAQDDLVRRFAGMGGLIAVGSHAGSQFIVPGAAVHREMELLVAAGLTPLQALRAATSDAARLLGADSLGRLGTGTVADLVVLTANPLDNIRNSREVSRVMIAGAWLQR